MRARQDAGQHGDRAGDDGDRGVARQAEAEGAEQRGDLGARRRVPGDDRARAPPREERRRRAAADPRPAEPEAEEMFLELSGDEGIGGADEMQHLDDLARAGHRAAGGEADRRSPSRRSSARTARAAKTTIAPAMTSSRDSHRR